MNECVARELMIKALRCSLWLAVFHAQRLELHELAHRLTVQLCEVDALTATTEM